MLLWKISIVLIIFLAMLVGMYDCAPAMVVLYVIAFYQGNLCIPSGENDFVFSTVYILCFVVSILGYIVFEERKGIRKKSKRIRMQKNIPNPYRGEYYVSYYELLKTFTSGTKVLYMGSVGKIMYMKRDKHLHTYFPETNEFVDISFDEDFKVLQWGKISN